MTGTTEKELKTSKWLANFPCYQTELGRELLSEFKVWTL